MGREERAWWHQALKTTERGWGEKSLGELLGIPSASEATRNVRSQERRSTFAAAGAQHDVFARVTHMYREQVPVAEKPLAPPPSLANREAMRRSYGREARKGISLWKRTARREARTAAAVRADRDADGADEKAQAKTAAIQAQLDLQWEALQRHERGAVLEALATAFSDFPDQTVAYAAIDNGSAVFVLFRDSVVPYSKPDLTPTGRLTVRKINKTDRNWLCSEAVASITINAARRALAATPGGSHASAVALQAGGLGYEAIAWIRISRREDSSWTKAPSAMSAFLSGGGAMGRKGRTRALAKADFSAWSKLEALVKTIKRGQDALREACPEGLHPVGAAIRVPSRGRG